MVIGAYEKLYYFELKFVVVDSFITVLHGMQMRSSYENSVCPSVHLPNACIVTKRKKVLSTFLYHMKNHLA